MVRTARLGGLDRPTAVVALQLATGVGLVALGQSLLLGTTPLGRALLVWLAGLALVVTAHAPVEPPLAHSSPDGRPAPKLVPWSTPGPLLVVVAAGWLAFEVALRMPGRPQDANYADITWLWALAMTCLVSAALWRDRLAAAVHRRIQLPSPRELAWLGAVLGVALAVRGIGLDRHPSVIDADAMSQALEAVDVRLGVITDPFSTGFFSNPLGFVYVLRASMAVFGETQAGAVALNVIIGTSTVLFTYLLARRWWGPPTALMAAALLATLYGHVYFSRTALNVLADGWFLVVTLWLLDKGIVDRQRWACALAGVAVGLSQYFYVSARMLVPILISTVAFLVVWRGHRAPDASAGEAAATVAWVLAGLVIAYLPLGINYLDHPDSFTGRIEQVSIFSGWIDQQMALTGDSKAEVLAGQAGRAALLPFETRPIAPTFHPRAPLVGWANAVPVAVGLAVVTARPWRRRQAGLVLAWWGILAGIGLTVEMTTPRWTLAWPLAALLAAQGLAATGRVLTERVGAPRRLVAGAGVAVVLALMGWNLATTFRASNELSVYSDVNSLVATKVAHLLRDEPAGTTVQMLAAPRMTYRSHSTIPFLAPQVRGIDILEPLQEERDVPPVTGPTLFVALPERAAELDVVRSAHPGGTTTDLRDHQGEVLCFIYRVPLHS